MMGRPDSHLDFMERTDNTVLKSLKAQGLRVTPQRYAVYANLLGRTDHPTVDQLMTDLNQEFPISSQATVYNSLKTLLDVGLVREVLLEEGVSRYDANTEPHHHFQCQGCGAIEDIAWDTFPALDVSRLRSGLVPERYEVTVMGRCDRCNQAH